MSDETTAREIVCRWNYDNIRMEDTPRLVRDIARAIESERGEILTLMVQEATMIRRMGYDSTAINLLVARLQQRGRDAERM